MANIQLNYYSNSDTSLIDLMNTADGTFIGKHNVSLTNYDNTSLPAVAVGSIVEVNGTLYKFTSESAISGSPSDGVVYIYLVPSGDPALGTAIITPTFSNVAPTWSDSKQGWYGTGGSANYRYLEFALYKNSALWYKFNLILPDKSSNVIVYAKAPGSQVISDTSATLLTLNEVYDIGNNFAGSIFTSPVDALYSIAFYAKNSPASVPFSKIWGQTSASAFDTDSFKFSELSVQSDRIRGKVSALMAGETYRIYVEFASTPTETITADTYLVIKKICDI